jgi:hypothetical protein
MLCIFQKSEPGNSKKKLRTIQNKIPAMAKIASTYKGLSIEYSNPV